jgi:hypothetical protein
MEHPKRYKKHLACCRLKGPRGAGQKSGTQYGRQLAFASSMDNAEGVIWLSRVDRVDGAKPLEVIRGSSGEFRDVALAGMAVKLP